MRPQKPEGNWSSQACRIPVQVRFRLRLRNSCVQPPVPFTQYMTLSRVEPPRAGAPSSVTERQTASSPVANRSCQMGRTFPGVGASKRTTSSPVLTSDGADRGDGSAAGLADVHRVPCNRPSGHLRQRMKFDDLATAERPGHAARAQTVIVFGDRGQHEALIPRARYGHSALCRKRPKSDLSRTCFFASGVWLWARPAEAKATTSICRPNPDPRVKCKLRDCDRRIFDAVRPLIPDG